MTKEERIAHLKILKSRITVFDEDDDKQVKALQETIQELEQEPCGDVISRQATLAEFKRLYYDDKTVTRCAELVINGMPPVTTEQKIGHWISFGVQGEVDGQVVQAFTCSECGAISVFRMASGNIVNGDTCPNCGCRMVEPQERSDKE